MRGTDGAGALQNARAIGLLGSAQALVLFAGLLRWKIIAVMLGPAGLGIVGLLDQVAQVALQLGSLSLPTVALRFLGIAHHDGTGTFGRLYRGFLYSVVAGGAIVALLAILLFLWRPALLGRGLEPYGIALMLALLVVPLTGAANLTRNALATLHRHRDTALAMSASAVALALGAYVGIRVGGILGLYAATLVASAMVAFLLDAIVRRDANAAVRGPAAGPLAQLRAQPDVLRYAATLCTVGFTVPLSYTILRSVVLEADGESAAGFLAAALTVATGARVVFTQASSQFLMPRASRTAPKEHRAAEVGGYLRTLVIAMLIAALPVVLFPGEVLRVLFSARFAPAATFIGAFLLGELMMAFGDAYRILLLGFDDLRGYLITTITAPAIVMLCAAPVMVRYGILGLGALHVLAAVIGLVVSQLRLRARHAIPADRHVIGLYLLMVVVVAGAAWLGGAVPGSSAAIWSWKLAVGVGCAGLGIGMLPAPERAALRRFLPWRRAAGARPR